MKGIAIQSRSNSVGLPKVFFVALLLSLILGLSASAGTLTGTIRNGTTGKPAAGVDVILIQLQGGMQPVANTKTDAKGQYKLDHPGIGAGPMLLRAQYRGVNYHQPVLPGKPTLDMDVFDPTDKPGTIALAARAVILQPNGSDLMVGEEYSFENKTQPPLTYYRADGSFIFSLPDGAQLNDVSAASSSGMPVVQGTIDKGKGQLAIAYAFRPGESEVRVSYKLSYPGNQARIRLISPYLANRFAVFAPPTMQISGDGLSPAGQAQGFNVYMRELAAANVPINVAISGTAPMPPQSAEGGPAGAQPPAGDDAQNPSVNSRAESAGDAPAVTATSLPARLDSLKWILVGGFAAIFLLGFFFLWRRPQGMLAGGDVAAPLNATASAPAVAAPRPATTSALTAAQVDREVRGSLDELKDNLFRLELRRQAGTINDQDYARERQRMEKTLRDLVKG